MKYAAVAESDDCYVHYIPTHIFWRKANDVEEKLLMFGKTARLHRACCQHKACVLFACMLAIIMYTIGKRTLLQDSCTIGKLVGGGVFFFFYLFFTFCIFL